MIEYGDPDRTRPTRASAPALRPHAQPEERTVVGLDGISPRERRRRHPQPRARAPGRRPLERRLPDSRRAGPGTLPIPHAYGRLQYGEDLDLHFRTMIGTGANANVAGVIVIGIEPNWTAHDRRRDRRDRQAGRGVFDRRPRRPRSRAPGLARRAAHRPARLRAAARADRARGADGQHQVRRVGHDDRPRSCPTVGASSTSSSTPGRRFSSARRQS